MRFVRSPVAAGRIERIAVPEGATVVTAADLAAVKPIKPMLHKFGYVPIAQPVLATGCVRFVGEPIAAVVAASEAQAEDIADAVSVEIDDAAPVIDARAALADGAPLVHAAGRAQRHRRRQGRRRRDLPPCKRAAHRLIAIELRSRRQNATPLEARAGHAAFDPVSGRVTLTCATQMPHLMRTAIADLIGMPESELRVIAPDVGGGFGQKMSLVPEYVVLVWLARKLRSSVAWTEDRRENLIASFHSRDQSIRLQGAFDADAKLARALRRSRRQCRRLFLLSDHLRGRAADGDGRAAGSLRRARLCVRRSRRPHQHLSDGAVSRRITSGDHHRRWSG